MSQCEQMPPWPSSGPCLLNAGHECEHANRFGDRWAIETPPRLSDAERYKFLRDGEYPASLLLLLQAAGVHKNDVDRAIDKAAAAESESALTHGLVGDSEHSRQAESLCRNEPNAVVEVMTYREKR